MIEPGWYADPAGTVGRFRWWDGSGWTRWLSPAPTAPDPTALAPTAPAPTAPAPTAEPMSPEPMSPEPARAMRPEPAEAAPTRPLAVQDPTVRAPLAAVIAVGAVILAVIAVAGVVAFSSTRTATGAAVAPPTPTTSIGSVVYDRTLRQARVQAMHYTLPGAPYRCEEEAFQLVGLFTSWLPCDAAVHPAYAPGKDWGSTLGLGVVDPHLVVPDDLEATTKRVRAAVLTTFYPPGTHGRFTKSTLELADIAAAGRSYLVSGEMHISVKGLPTRYDKVLLVVVRLEDGQTAAWIAAIPNDRPKMVIEAARISAATISARS